MDSRKQESFLLRLTNCRLRLNCFSEAATQRQSAPPIDLLKASTELRKRPPIESNSRQLLSYELRKSPPLELNMKWQLSFATFLALNLTLNRYGAPKTFLSLVLM